MNSSVMKIGLLYVLLNICNLNYIHSQEVDSIRTAVADSMEIETKTAAKMIGKSKKVPVSIYELPYSTSKSSYDWPRLWNNTAVLSSAFVGTLLVLECLPEDATSWNRAELQDVPLLKRWHNHVIKKGPEWDHDKFYFNYILHPYAGAAYFMAARSCGFNFWKSTLYGSIVSTVGWEYGIEAFMERPSIQDLFLTPIVGSCIGEGFYRVKRWLVDNDYQLFGSHFWGGVLAFLVDPVNEFTGLWLGNPARRLAHAKASSRARSTISVFPSVNRTFKGFSLVVQL